MNDIETHVLRLIGESVGAPDVFTDDATGMALILGSINDAIQELCMVSGSYRRIYHLALLTGRQFYRIAPQNDYLGYVVGIFDRTNRRRLQRTDILSLPIRDPWWMKHTGPALEYMQLGLNHVGIYMMPSVKGVVLEMDCVMIPRPYVQDSDPVKVRSNFQKAATYFAVSEFYASRGDAKRGAEYHARYIESANLLTLHPTYGDKQYRFGGYDPKTTGAVESVV
jgi:hypothetical protein